jgi:hypothetical protein
MTVVVAIGCAAIAQAAPLTSLTVTGGEFNIGGLPGGTLHPGAFANMSVDGVTYDGMVPAVACSDEAGFAPTSVATATFGFFGPVAMFTASYDASHPVGTFAAVSGDLTGNILTLNLDSWTCYWCGHVFNQGDTSVIAITDGAGNFAASWTSTVVSGPFNGQTGNWTLTGNITAVPEPLSMTLVASGLVGLAGLARLRRLAALAVGCSGGSAADRRRLNERRMS